MRNEKGQFVKGITPHNKGVVGYTNAGTFKKGHKHLNPTALLDWIASGGEPWNKGQHIQLNTGRTHFKKGQIPHNFKGGISKTKEYKNHYKARRRVQQRNAEGSHTFTEWENLKAKFNYMCLCCKKTEPEITLSKDHIVPLVAGGTDDINNIQPLCCSCNSRKHIKTINYIEQLCLT
jgi:hypothetical protein